MEPQTANLNQLRDDLRKEIEALSGMLPSEKLAALNALIRRIPRTLENGVTVSELPDGNLQQVVVRKLVLRIPVEFEEVSTLQVKWRSSSQKTLEEIDKENLGSPVREAAPNQTTPPAPQS